MVKIINFFVILLLVLLVSTEKGEAQAQAQGCEWECEHLPNFKCWLGDVGHNLCHSFCTKEGAVTGVCVSNPHRCLCRKAGCS